MFTSRVAGHFTLPLISLFPLAPIAPAGSASNFKLADNSTLPAGWKSATAHRSIAAVSVPAAISPANVDDTHTLAGITAWGYDPNASEGAAAWWPGAAFGAMLLLVVAGLSFWQIFGRGGNKDKPKTKGASLGERETIPADSAEDIAERPTVAETPRAQGKRLSHVRVGGEIMPGASIAPPPHHGMKRGGKGIQ